MASSTLADAPELLDVDVQQLARPLALIAVGRLRRLKPRELAEPIRVRMPCTVESAIPNASAISAPVMRTRLSVAIASIRFWLVAVGRLLGAEERSPTPASPSAR